MSDRVVVTGVGVVSPCGTTFDETWEHLVAGKSAIRSIDRFPTYEFSAAAAGTVPGYEGPPPPDRSLALEFGMIALRAAMDDAGVSDEGGVDLLAVSNHGERRLPKIGEDGVIAPVNTIVEQLGRQAGATRTLAVYGACAGGGLAIGTGYRLLEQGHGDVAVVGGTDCLLRDYDFYQFSSLCAMSTRECDPTEASSPFDANRDGFVLAEGAGFLVLEREAHALARGVNVLGVIAGYGYSQNAYHIVASPPDGLGPTRAMRRALDESKLDPSAIGYINAHGTSTRDNDWCETLAIHNALGASAKDVAISSTKSMTGHPMGAAGAIEVAITLRVLAEGVLPPTINQWTPDPRCDLDYIPWTAREQEVEHAMSNSFGFGGHNSSLVLSRA